MSKSAIGQSHALTGAVVYWVWLGREKVTCGQRLDSIIEQIDGVCLQKVAEAMVQLPEAALLGSHPLPGLPVRWDVPQMLCTTLTYQTLLFCKQCQCFDIHCKTIAHAGAALSES